MSLLRKRNDSCNTEDSEQDLHAEKKISWPKTNAERLDNGFLSDCYIHLHAASLSKTRKALFEKQILSNGGTLITNTSSPSNAKRIFVLIDDDLVQKERINQLIEKILASSSQDKEW